MKKWISMLLAVALALSAVACSRPGKTDAPDSQGLSYPITVTDHAGRQVVIEKEPQKIVSCYYITSSLLMALGLEDKMVGIEDNPEFRPIYGLSAPHLLELPWVGTAKVLDVEGCAALEPDLVILPLRQKESAEILESLGIDVLLVNPESQTLLTEMIQMVASATNTQDKGDELIAFLDKQEAKLNQILAGVAAPRVYMASNSNMLATAGDGMYQSDMIRLAGGANVAAEIEDTYWVEIDYEQLLNWNPEYIILASDADYTVEDVLADPNLVDCAAVVNGNVYQMPSKAEAWDSPVPSGILGSVWLANVLHADLFSEADCAAVIDEYYENFYDFTYSEN